jgi:hypothetical protein
MTDIKTRVHSGDVSFQVHAEDGKMHTVQDSPQVRLEEMIRALVEARLIPGVDRLGRPIQWCLDDKEAGKTLDNARTLQENGVHSGHHLYLRRLVPPDVTLHVHTEDGTTHMVEVSAQVTAETVIRQLVEARLVRGVDDPGHRIDWRFDDKEAGKTLGRCQNPARKWGP